jgi:Zn-dependent protease
MRSDDVEKTDLRRDASGVEYHTEYSYSTEPSFSSSHRPKGKGVHFSKPEVLHLLGASALLLLLSYSVVSPLLFPIQFDLTSFIFYTLVLFLAFIPHELMHKAIAQRYGLYAEFRIIPYYALLTLLFILLPYKLFAPGAVMIGGAASQREYGKTAAAGPATNVVLGGTLLGLAPIFPSYAPFLLFGAWFSGWLSFFNMLPVFPFDGEKVIHWSRAAFAVLISASIVLFLLPLYLFM